MIGCTIDILERAGMARKRSGSELILSIALISAFALGGCSRGESSSEYLKDAQNYHAHGDNKSAIIQLKNALQKDPNNGEARFLLGEIYRETGNFSAAEDELQMALQYEKNRSLVQLALGKVYLGRGEYQKVIDELQIEAGMDTQTKAGVLAIRGGAYIGLGRNDEARTAFADALKAAPDFQDALLGEARLAAAEKKPDDALKLVGEALSKDPKSVNAWIMQGDLYRAQSNNDKALEAYQEILKFDSANIPARVSLTSIDLAIGKYDDAKREIDALNKIQPNSLMAKYLQALLYFRQSKLTDARDELLQVLKGSPDHMPSILLMGAIDYSLNSLEEAQKNLGRFVGAFPSNVYARKLLASTQLKLKDPLEAIKTLSPLLGDLNPDPQVLSLAAEAYTETGDYAKAAQYLESVTALEPDNADLRTQLGLSRVANGQTERAISDFEAAAKLNPSQMQAETALALTYMGKKQYDKALAEAKKMAGKDPKNPVFYNLEGAAYVGMNDISNARKSFGRAIEIDSSYAPAYLNLAMLDLKEENPQSASKRLMDVLAVDKNNLQAMTMLSAIAHNSGNSKDEADWLERAVKSNPSVLQPRVALTRHYLMQKNQKAALDTAKAAVTAMPKDPQALDLLGAAQIAAGQSKEAIGTFQNLVKMVPQSPVAYFRLATAQMVNQDNASAANSLAKALELKPDYLDADSALISLDVKAKNYSAAEKIARDVQKRLPKFPIGWYLEGDILMAQRQFGEAADIFQKAQQISPSSLGMMKLHGAMSLSGNAKRADVLLLQWVRTHPKDILTGRYLAEVYMKEGSAKAATQQFQSVLKSDPNDVESLNDLALLYQQEKNPAAEQVARKAFELAPGNPQVMDTLGWILVEKGELKNALDLLQKAASMLSDVPEIHYHYAVALSRTGERTKARQELQNLLSSGKDFPERGEASSMLGQL